MGIKEGSNIEVVLDNNIERDSLGGTYVGWEEFHGTMYLKVRMEGSDISYISQRVIRAIHVYTKVHSQGPKGKRGPDG